MFRRIIVVYPSFYSITIITLRTRSKARTMDLSDTQLLGTHKLGGHAMKSIITLVKKLKLLN